MANAFADNSTNQGNTGWCRGAVMSLLVASRRIDLVREALFAVQVFEGVLANLLHALYFRTCPAYSDCAVRSRAHFAATYPLVRILHDGSHRHRFLLDIRRWQGLQF